MNISQTNTADHSSVGFSHIGRFSLMLSVMLPYLPPNLRQPLFIFSRIYECMQCMKLGKACFAGANCAASDPDTAMQEMLNRMMPLLDEKERAQLEQMQSMLQMFKLYQSFQDVTPFMNQSPDNLFSMLDPEQQAMFQTLKSAMNSSDDSTSSQS